MQTSAASTPLGLRLKFSAATPNNTTSWFLYADDSTNAKAIIYSDGSFQSRANSYGGISDLKLKQDIVDAASQWDDIKALRVRKFRFKDEVAADPNYPAHIGVIAQELEEVSPGLVFESPDKDADTVTKGVKYSVLYMKAIKALQEAMARIEALEVEVAALKAGA